MDLPLHSNTYQELSSNQRIELPSKAYQPELPTNTRTELSTNLTPRHYQELSSQYRFELPHHPINELGYNPSSRVYEVGQHG